MDRLLGDTRAAKVDFLQAAQIFKQKHQAILDVRTAKKRHFFEEVALG